MKNAELSQIAIVVRDVEAAAKAWADILGVETPKAILTDPQEKSHTLYRGAPTQARAKLAFFKLGSVTLELIEPVGGPSTWQEFLDRHGEGVHHFGFVVKDMDGELKNLEAKGAHTVQRGDFPGGRYAYVDATEHLKAILELLQVD